MQLPNLALYIAVLAAMFFGQLIFGLIKDWFPALGTGNVLVAFLVSGGTTTIVLFYILKKYRAAKSGL